MQYDVEFIGKENGTSCLELDRFSLFAKSIKDIAVKSFNFYFNGFSGLRLNKKYEKAFEITLEDIKFHILNKNNKIIVLNTKLFNESLVGHQYDMFNSELDLLLNYSPISLLMKTFNEVKKEGDQFNTFDKPIINSILGFRKIFKDDLSEIIISNRGTVENLSIRSIDFENIGIEELSIPNSHKAIVSGNLDEVKISKSKLGIETENGIVSVVANDSLFFSNLLKLLGKEVTIYGIAHFSINGKLTVLEAEDFSLYADKDKYFSKVPTSLPFNGVNLSGSINSPNKGNSLELLENLSRYINEDENSSLADFFEK